MLLSTSRLTSVSLKVRLIGGRHPQEIGWPFFLRLELLRVFDHVFFQGVEIRQHVRQVGIVLAQLRQQMADGQARGLAVQFLDLVAGLQPPARDPLDDLLQFLLQFLDRVLDLPTLLPGQLFVFLRPDHLPAADRRHGIAARCADQLNAALQRPIREFLEGPVVSLLGLLFDFLNAVLVLFQLQRGGNGGLEFFHQMRHVTLQLGSQTGRQAERPGLVRLLEVVDVAPVVGRGLVGGLFAQEVVDRGAFAEPGRAEHEHVVPIPPNADPKLDGVQRRGLAQNLLQILQLIGALECQMICRAAPSQLGRTESHRAVPASVPSVFRSDAWDQRSAGSLMAAGPLRASRAGAGSQSCRRAMWFRTTLSYVIR